MTTAAEEITIDFSKTYQKIDGFGGGFSDATGINVASLSDALQEHFLKCYFDPNGGISYNLGRVPIASCDFSLGNYSYDDVEGDFELKHFSLSSEDLEYKIPLIKKAFTLSNGTLKVFGCPWSSPYWLKTNHMMQGRGTLIGKPGGKYYKTWAKYLTKFVSEYEKRGVHIWSLGVENEPMEGLIRECPFQVLGFTAETERDFIKYDLGPALVEIGRPDLKLMIMDDELYMLEKWANAVLSDPEASKYVSHIALHWYMNTLTSIDVLDAVHERFPNFSLIGTEACTGFLSLNPVILGSWERAEEYANDIIQSINHWYTGWVDWNMALNVQGGPNWVKNFVDSPVVVNASADEFYKQPTYYAMGHFSAFVPRDSVRVSLKTSRKFPNIKYVAFKTADDRKVIVILNRNDFDNKIAIREEHGSKRNKQLWYTAKARTLSTLIWR